MPATIHHVIAGFKATACKGVNDGYRISASRLTPNIATLVLPLSPASRIEGKKEKKGFTLYAASAGERVVQRSVDRVSRSQRSKPLPL
jgi:hypothetical protein